MPVVAYDVLQRKIYSFVPVVEILVPIGRDKKGVHFLLKQKLPNPQLSNIGVVSEQPEFVANTGAQNLLYGLQ